jgi:alkylation response protein AidB-like acyl-CoA dehydrogenase
MSVATLSRTGHLLDEGLLNRFRERAPGYDRENRFFHEDFDDLRAAGYLKVSVPEEYGGAGFDLGRYCREVARLASYAPPTALATNMHVIWTGIAADLRAHGDPKLEWLLEEAAAGEVFANGHGERGNDLNGFLSTVEARKDGDGYCFFGHKIFGSLSPVWTRLAVWGMDANHPDGPQMVHGFITRDGGGYRIIDTWDTLGMRATRSDDTVLEGARSSGKQTMLVLPAGTADQTLLFMYAWAETSFGSIYNGIAGRAMDLAIESARSKTSLGLTRSMAHHPELQHEAAEMAILQEASSALIRATTDDWVMDVDHGDRWFVKLLATKHFAVDSAQKIVDLAMRMSGGTGMFKANELERLYRDVRCGGFHPANSSLVHEVVGKSVLGVDLAAQPRWG